MTTLLQLTPPATLEGCCSLENRIRKNYKHFCKWAKRTSTDCFRIYDRDIKEYPLAIDFYAGKFCVHYFLSRGDEEPPHERVELVDEILQKLFGASQDDIYWRHRIRRKKVEQYEKQSALEEFFTVVEYGVKFRVNLQDYLDTGLFLDHRETRQMVSKLATGKHVLNLFCYTGAFSVHAALAGALTTKSVDMSNTYLAWAKENFHLNNLHLKNHTFQRADCLKFLEEEKKKYDLVVIDPPTISRSKKMEKLFDVQVDYVFLLKRASQILSEGGIIFFSTNARNFHLDETLFPELSFQDITHKTLPQDFHNKKIHKCWMIRPHAYLH